MNENRKMAIASLVLKKTTQKIIATIPLDQLEDKMATGPYSLINPVEYAFVRGADDNMIVSFAPYIIGYKQTQIEFDRIDILTIYPADEETCKAYFANAEPMYSALPIPGPPKTEKTSNISVLPKLKPKPLIH